MEAAKAAEVRRFYQEESTNHDTFRVFPRRGKRPVPGLPSAVNSTSKIAGASLLADLENQKLTDMSHAKAAALCRSKLQELLRRGGDDRTFAKEGLDRLDDSEKNLANKMIVYGPKKAYTLPPASRNDFVTFERGERHGTRTKLPLVCKRSPFERGTFTASPLMSRQIPIRFDLYGNQEFQGASITSVARTALAHTALALASLPLASLPLASLPLASLPPYLASFIPRFLPPRFLSPRFLPTSLPLTLLPPYLASFHVASQVGDPVGTLTNICTDPYGDIGCG